MKTKSKEPLLTRDVQRERPMAREWTTSVEGKEFRLCCGTMLVRASLTEGKLLTEIKDLHNADLVALISSASQPDTQDRENDKVGPWIRTAERKPTSNEAATNFWDHILIRNGATIEVCHWCSYKVGEAEFWMPIPPVPEGQQAK